MSTSASGRRISLARVTAALLSVAVCAVAALPSMAQADTFPSRAITLVAPYPPGGATDVLTRKVGEKLQKLLGQTVILENRAGAGGTLAAGYVAKAPPDGYTLLMGVTGTSAIAGALYRKLPFDPATSFAPVSLIVTAPLVLLPRSELAAKNFGDYIRLAKSKPDAISFASPGNGTTMHLAGAMLGAETGATLLHVPYKGSGPALQNLMGNQVDSMFADLMQVLPMIQSGDLKAIAVTSRQRHPLLPNVPTVAEAGFPAYEALSWHALFAPAGTPPEVIDKLYAAVSQALKEPDMQKHFESLGLVIDGRPPAQTQAFVQAEIRKWGRIVKETGATPE
jgi:tripartite-type tricarboxylate transporter receptor subunit TctC